MGFFPLSQQLRLVEEHFSPGLARHAVWLAGLVPYEQAEAILAQIGGMAVSASTIWRRVQQWGQQFAALEEGERAQAQALPEQWQPPSRAEQTDQRMGVALDGFMVHITTKTGRR